MKLLRRRDVMERLGLTYKQLDKLIDSGLIRPIRKNGCRWWFRNSEIEKLV